MPNIIDHYLHQTYEPVNFHRQYDQDFERTDDTPEVIIRIVQIALPYIALKKSYGNALSIAMGTLRSIVLLRKALKADNQKEQAPAMIQLAFATTSVVSAYYHHRLGLIISTAGDIAGNILSQKELIQSLNSTLYLTVMVTASLEIRISSALVQASCSFYDSAHEWREGKHPEALSKFGIGIIRLFETSKQLSLLLKRPHLTQKYPLLAKNLTHEKALHHLKHHPLTHPPRNHATLMLANRPYDFGVNVFKYGKQHVKGMNLRFWHQKQGEVLDFKLNHFHRKKLQSVIEEIQKPNSELKTLLQMKLSDASDIRIKTVNLDFDKHGFFGPTYQIDIDGLGTLLVGASEEYPNLYDKVAVVLDKDKILYDFHKTLSILGLENALKESHPEDLERMKLGFLYRIIDPRSATPLERTEPFFSLPLEELKKQMIGSNPQKEELFQTLLPKMEFREIIPGRYRIAIPGLADTLRQKGAKELTAAITGSHTQEELHQKIHSILTGGMLSTEMRRIGSVPFDGLSPSYDLETGSADSVFTQMVTTNMIDYQTLQYQRPVRLLFSLEALETGSYQYLYDNFGERNIDAIEYLNRPDIFTFTEKHTAQTFTDNEVMIKERIPPKYITGIVLESETLKQSLAHYLQSHGLDTINKTPLDTFLQVQ